MALAFLMTNRSEKKWREISTQNEGPGCPYSLYSPWRVGNGLWFHLVEGIDQFLSSSLLLNFLQSREH